MSSRLICKTHFSPLEHTLFTQMYHAYDLELSQYSERLRNDPITSEGINSILKHDFLRKYFVLSDTGAIVGFLLVGFSENTHPCTEYYISEFYIRPDYRRSGVGVSAIKELLSLYPGKYCYHVLKDNSAAHQFWEYVKSICDCSELDLTDTSDVTDCNFFAFDFVKQELPMNPGYRIKHIRTLKGLTQKELGTSIGFNEKTADIRISQYESGLRVPKENTFKALADVLGVDQKALTVPSIHSFDDVSHILFALEDKCDINPRTIIALSNLLLESLSDAERSNNPFFDFLFEWNDVAIKLVHGVITKKEYDLWRYSYSTKA